MAVNTLKKLCCCCCCEQTLSLDEQALYPSINPSEQLLSISTITSFESSTESESSRCLSMNSFVGYDRSQYEHNFTISFREDEGAQGIKQSPPLECFIVPSFGQDPPDNVAVKKMAGDFLKGVGQDFDIIQQLIKEDGDKQLLEVRFMCHFAQKKVEEFKKAIGDAMKSLKLKRTQKGCKYIHNNTYSSYLGCTRCMVECIPINVIKSTLTRVCNLHSSSVDGVFHE